MDSFSSNSSEVVSFERVSLRYGLREEVFRNLNFTLFSGTFHFLTGASGAGKTSLLKLIYMNAFPTFGNVRVFGRNTQAVRLKDIPYIRQRMGVVFQDFNLLDHLNLIENVSLPLRIRGVSEEECFDRAMEILAWVGLADFVYSHPFALSGGQQQRAAIARAVITKPHLLLADEPTGNVDNENGRKLLYLFEQMNKMGTTVIVATHDRSLAKEYKYPELHLCDGGVNLIEHQHEIEGEEQFETAAKLSSIRIPQSRKGFMGVSI